MNIEEIKNKAEQSWVSCDGCIQDDKQMWINGYLAGALSNQIELPSDAYIKEESDSMDNHDEYELGKIDGFILGAKWVIEQIKQQDK